MEGIVLTQTVLTACVFSGYHDRKNNLIITGKTDSADAVMFFGGDIQDLEDDMLAHSETASFSHWSLEQTATLLETKFPNQRIIAVRPSRKRDVVFSCFDNFVKFTDNLSPSEYVANNHALEHLDLLLKNVSDSLSKPAVENVKVVGFSKGCVVLNQLVYELQTWLMCPAATVPSIVYRIRDMYWLDAGHSGPPEYWITNLRLLESLEKLQIGVHVVTSPYQTGNRQRSAYVPELKKFLTICSDLGVLRESKKVHAEKVWPAVSIEDHFDTLRLM